MRPYSAMMDQVILGREGDLGEKENSRLSSASVAIVMVVAGVAPPAPTSTSSGWRPIR